MDTHQRGKNSGCPRFPFKRKSGLVTKILLSEGAFANRQCRCKQACRLECNTGSMTIQDMKKSDNADSGKADL